MPSDRETDTFRVDIDGVDVVLGQPEESLLERHEKAIESVARSWRPPPRSAPTTRRRSRCVETSRPTE